MDWVNTLMFDAEGRYLYSGSHDATIRRWPVQLDDWTQRACQIANRNLTPEESQTFLRLTVAIETC
jgi:hypothetical protein